VTSNNPTAEIVDMEDVRARRRAGETAGGEAENAGGRLAAARVAAGFTLSEAAAKTHIKERHLEAIEAIDLEALPARPYAIGFVKTYAEFLGLDAADLVDRFKEDAGYVAPPAPEVEKFEAAQNAAETGNRELSFMTVAAILIFFIWCAYQITLLDEEKRRVPAAGLPAAGEADSAPATEAALPAGEAIEVQVVERIEPVYPMRCMDNASQTETVDVLFNVTATGRVYGESIVRSTNACFDEAALNAIRRWRFEPLRSEGGPRAAYDQRASLSFNRPQ